jgi:hypothetical protein
VGSRCAACFLLAWTAALTACAGSSTAPILPTEPKTVTTQPIPPGTSFAGRWSGTTFVGFPIAFTVSADQKLTELTVSPCPAGRTFKLNLDVVRDDDVGWVQRREAVATRIIRCRRLG